MIELDEVDAARAQEYALLAALLARAPDADVARRLATLRGDATPLGHGACGARRSGEPRQCPNASSASIFDLFIGLGRGELLPYGSYYLTGFLHERPLARLRARSGASSESSARQARPSPRITRRSCARSWRGWRAAAFRLQPAPIASCSRSISRPGSGASSPIWSAPSAARLLPPGRHARPRVHRDRDGGFRAAGVNGVMRKH